MKYVATPFIAMVILAIALSCTKNLEKIPIEVILFDKITENKEGLKYPEYLLEILNPMSEFCENKMVIGFYPVKIKRRDLNDEIDFNYITTKAGNDKKIKFVARQLKNFFETAKIDPILLKSTPLPGSFDSYINAQMVKDNLFFYSDNEESRINGFKVHYTVEDLRKAISKYMCQTKNDIAKVTVVVLPPSEAMIVFAPEDKPSSALPPKELQSAFEELTNLNISPNERAKLIPNLLEHLFSEGSTIEKYGENGTSVGIHTTKDYLYSLVLSRSIDRIQILDAKKDNTDRKFWTVKLVEHHRLSL